MLTAFFNHMDTQLYPPTDSLKRLQIDEVIGLCTDFNRAMTPSHYMNMRPELFGYPAEFQKTEEGKAKVKTMRENFVASVLPGLMKYYGDVLGDKAFMCGATPTIAGFFFFFFFFPFFFFFFFAVY